MQIDWRGPECAGGQHGMPACRRGGQNRGIRAPVHGDDKAEPAAVLSGKLQPPCRTEIEPAHRLQRNVPAGAQALMGGMQEIVRAREPNQDNPLRIEPCLCQARRVKAACEAVLRAPKDGAFAARQHKAREQGGRRAAEFMHASADKGLAQHDIRLRTPEGQVARETGPRSFNGADGTA